VHPRTTVRIMDRNHGLRRRAEQQLWCRRGLFAALAVAVVGVWYACLPAVMKLIVVHRDHIEVWARALIALGELPDAAKLPPVRVPGLGVEGHLLVPIQAGLLRVASTETALVGLFGVVYLAAFAICLGDPRARGGRLWLLAAMIDPPIWYIALGGWYPGLAMPLLLLALVEVVPKGVIGQFGAFPALQGEGVAFQEIGNGDACLTEQGRHDVDARGHARGGCPFGDRPGMRENERDRDRAFVKGVLFTHAVVVEVFSVVGEVDHQGVFTLATAVKGPEYASDAVVHGADEGQISGGRVAHPVLRVVLNIEILETRPKAWG